MAPPRMEPTQSGRQGHGLLLGVLVLVSSKNWGVGGDRTRVKTPLLYPHQGYLAKIGLDRQSVLGYFQATIL